MLGRNGSLEETAILGSRFQSDNWSSQSPIKNLIQGPQNKEEGDMKVKEVISVNGWNWSKISFELPLSIKLEVQATPYALAARCKIDCLGQLIPMGILILKVRISWQQQVMTIMILEGNGYGNYKFFQEFNFCLEMSS